MRTIFILLIVIPMFFSCESVSESFGTSNIEEDCYAKIDVIQHDLTDDESKTSDYTATIESIGTFDICSGEKFLLLTEGSYDLAEYPQVLVYNKLTDDITITNDFLSEEKIIVSSSYRYGVANNDGENIFYGVTSLDISQSQDLYECSVDVYKIIKDQLFNIKIGENLTNNIDTMYATMSGVAQKWDLTNDCPEGDASTIELPITPYDYSTDNLSLVRLLGIDTLQRQYVTVTVKYKDGIFDDLSATFDVTGEMGDFNKDKSKEADMITLEMGDVDNLSDGSINGWGEEQIGDEYIAEKHEF